MQTSKETSSCENLNQNDQDTTTYNEYYKLVDVVMTAALDELKLRAIDRRNAQDAKLRQLLYLCLMLITSICGMVVLTPYWSGGNAVLHGATGWHMVLLSISFVLCVSGGVYGIWALMGERGGTVPIVDEYMQILRNGYGEDGSGKPYEATIEWLKTTDSALEEFKIIISEKAQKIRTLNKIVLCAAGCAALAAFALFSTTLLENYVKHHQETVCSQTTSSKEDGRQQLQSREKV